MPATVIHTTASTAIGKLKEIRGVSIGTCRERLHAYPVSDCTLKPLAIARALRERLHADKNAFSTEFNPSLSFRLRYPDEAFSLN